MTSSSLAVLAFPVPVFGPSVVPNSYLASVLSMLRVALEVRIFPVLTLMLGVSPYVQMLIDDLTTLGFVASLEKVDYEFQKA